MKKKKIILSLFFLLFFLNGCGYKPILKGIDYDFTIKVGSNTGNKKINSQIENKIRIVDGAKRTFKIIPSFLLLIFLSSVLITGERSNTIKAFLGFSIFDFL